MYSKLKNKIEEHFSESAENKASGLIPIFYYILLLLSFLRLEGFAHITPVRPENFNPEWPLFWATNFTFESAVTGIFLFFILSALIGSFFYKKRWARITSFIGLFQYHAYTNSLGGAQHQLDLWLWVSLFLIFLPDLDKKKIAHYKEKILTVFMGIQAFVLTTYTMSGIGKLIGIVQQYIQGEPTILAPDGATLYIIGAIQQFSGNAIFETFLIQSPTIGTILILLTLYIEVFSLCIIFRPALHKIWGVLLILFHLGTLVFMGAIFTWHIPLLAIILLGSPFYKKQPIKESLKEFPLIKGITSVYKHG